MTAETTSTVRVTATAEDQKAGMTLDELAAFVTAAMKADLPGDTLIKQTSTWRGTIKRVEAHGVT